MEKIKILKTELTSLGFNINIFADILTHLGDYIPDISIDPIEAWGSAEAYQVVIKDRQLFTFDAKDIFIIRQLLATGYFMIEQNENETHMRMRDNVKIDSNTIKIRIDKIAYGSIHNVPANTDIEVKKIIGSPFYNFDTKDLTESSLRKLLTKSEALYDIKLVLPSIDDKLNYANKSSKFKYEPQEVVATVNPFNVGVLNKYFQQKSNCLPTKSMDIFMSRLYYGGLLEILRELVNRKEGAIEKFMTQNENIKFVRSFRQKSYERLYQQTNLFNRLVNMMKKSAKSYETILEKINTLRVTSIRSLMDVISKTDGDKLTKLIDVGLPVINNCSHNNAFQPFYAARNKKDKYAILEGLKSEYVRHDEAGHVFRCKKCDQFLYCEHTIEFDDAATIGLNIPSEIKSKIADKYHDLMISDVNGTVFCKYCGEKIHRYQNDEIVDGSIFNAMSHARSIEGDSLSELSIVKNESFIAIRKVLDSFIFKYDINRMALMRDIQNIIMYYILNDLTTLKIKAEDEHFESYAQLISAIYTYIYMMDLYIRDPNIIMKDTRATPKLNINEYAAEFANRVMQLYRYVTTDTERVSKMIKNAYLAMKNQFRGEVNVITDKDIAMYTINNPYYQFLYYLYCMEKRDKKRDMADAYHHIIKVNPAKEWFLNGAYSPSSAMWKSGIYKYFAETYEMNLNFESKYNVFCPSTVQYDPTMLNNRQKVIDKRVHDIRRLRYRNLMFRDEHMEVFKAVPACYVYDDSLNMFEWEPVIENKKVVDYVSKSGESTAKLSKLKCDLAKSDSIIGRVSPDKRTKSFGKPKVEKAIKLENESDQHRDIQFNIIKKISQSLSPNQLKFIGQSGGVTFTEFNKGNVLPTDYFLCMLKLDSYIKHFIRRYNSLRYNVNRSDNLKYFEQAGIISKIQQYTIDRFPDITKFLDKPKIDSKNRYVQMQEYIVKVIDILMKANDPILRLFTIEVITEILNIDKTYCISSTFVAESNDTTIDDEDAIGNNDNVEEANEDDEGFVDTDYIDYEEDVDEEHDPM